jgi:hypothetical protein
LANDRSWPLVGRCADCPPREFAVAKALERGFVDVDAEAGRGGNVNVAVLRPKRVALDLVAHVNEADNFVSAFQKVASKRKPYR